MEKRLLKTAKLLYVYYPFTFTGSILFFAALYLFVLSLTIKNPYGTLLSALALIVLILFGILCRIQAIRFGNSNIHWESTVDIYAGRMDNEQVLHLPDYKTFFFFRLHFRIGGKITVGNNAYLLAVKEEATPGGENLAIGLYSPFCGVYDATGTITIRDIFRLSRGMCTGEYKKQLHIKPAPFPDSRELSIHVTGGLDSKNRQKNSDEEKYYMREYIP
ncbi:MAG: hypothetical protein AB1798_05535, partial [Spirochaetota bacterium]